MVSSTATGRFVLFLFCFFNFSSRAHTSGALELTYLANEGFLARAGDKAVLFDALFRKGIPEYDRVPPERLEKIETGQPPFRDVTLALISHVHADHFDAQSAGRFLASHPSAVLVSSPEVAHAMEGSYAAYPRIRRQMRKVLPDWNRVVSLTEGGIPLKIFRLAHGKTQNLAFEVDLAGRAVLHIGDADVPIQDLSLFGLVGDKVDVAFVPYWQLLDQMGAKAIRDQVRPRHIVAMHLVTHGSDDPDFEKDIQAEGGPAGIVRKIRAAFPDAVIYSAPLERKSF